MRQYRRRVVIGIAAGLAASPALLQVSGAPAAILLLAALLGAASGVAFAAQGGGAYADSAAGAAALGIGCWMLFSVVLFPWAGGRDPQWTPETMRNLLPRLAAWLFFGAGTGLAVQAINDAVRRLLGPEPSPAGAGQTPACTEIVILGGGFAGMTTAAELEKVFGADRRVSFTLVSESNALLFTPMLAEVAGSSLEPTHISAPLRTALRRTRVVRGRAIGVDTERQRVRVALAETAGRTGVAPPVQELPYDHLVLALGAVPNYFGMAALEKYAFSFKSLLDAMRIRNHVIEMFERADRETDADRRRALLTFVVAGGGFAGVELAGALNDFTRGMLADYPGLRAGDLRIVLVHAGNRILPELSESLGEYARRSMAERGVTFELNVRLTDARRGAVVLAGGREIAAETLVWAAGAAPHPLIRDLGLETDRRGAALADSTFAVPNRHGLWALGDCAAVINTRTGKPCPPTAQFAVRQGRALARNLSAVLQGRAPKPFGFDSLGALCVVGHHTACAELAIPCAPQRSVRFSGLLAWLMWRAIYLGKLPGLDRKIRVLFDWTVELFFPRDIVQTIDLSDPSPAALSRMVENEARVAG